MKKSNIKKIAIILATLILIVNVTTIERIGDLKGNLGARTNYEGNTETETYGNPGFTHRRLTKDRTFGYANEHAKNLDTEALFGVHLSIRGNQCIIKYYSHIPETQEAIVYACRQHADEKAFLRDTYIKDGETVTINLNDSKDDEAIIGYASKDDSMGGYGFLVKKDGEWFIYTDVNAGICDRIDAFTKDLNPKDYLGTSKLTYPTSGYNGHLVQVKEWMQIADDIIKENEAENASDEYKVFLFSKHLVENYAFDDWAEKQGMGRHHLRGVYTDPSLFMLNTKVGVCWDFTNVLTIMCRHYGIPATSLDSDDINHTISLVYAGNKWLCIDLTQYVKLCTIEDLSHPEFWRKSIQPEFQNFGYANFWADTYSINQQIWTAYTATANLHDTHRIYMKDGIWVSEKIK